MDDCISDTGGTKGLGRGRLAGGMGLYAITQVVARAPALVPRRCVISVWGHQCSGHNGWLLVDKIWKVQSVSCGKGRPFFPIIDITTGGGPS